MALFDNILIALQDNEEAASLLRKAQTLGCDKSNQAAKLHVVRVLFEGLAEITPQDVAGSIDLKQLILESSEEELTQLVEDHTHNNMSVESAVLWNHRTWEGILHAAETSDADVIIKGAESDSRGLVRTPDDWNLLRNAKIPVLLSQSKFWSREPTVLVAIDAIDDVHEDLNLRILTQAVDLCRELQGSLHICTFYPLFRPWSVRLGILESYSKLRKEIERDVAVTVNRLVRTIGSPNYVLHCIEGKADLGINSLASDIDADLVVIGNCARSGIEGAVIGNTAEKILDRVATDILTIM